MSTPLPTRLVQAAETVIHEALHAAGKECFGGATPEARAAVIAVLRVLEEVAPGTPEYAIEWDFGYLADEIEGA